MQRDRRLGRGLGKLLGAAAQEVPAAAKFESSDGASTSAASDATPFRRLQIAKIEPNPWQPRVAFPTAELEELVDSIRTHGLLQPVAVRQTAGGFQLVAGERRLRACKELGLTEIPAVVVEASDQQMIEWAIIENLQRSSLDPIETARGFRRLMTEFRLTQEEAASRLGQSRAHVANTLRLLDLPQDVLALVSRGTLAPGAARAILALKGPEAQRAMAERVAKEGLSVRDVESFVRSEATKGQRKGEAASQDANRVEAVEELQRALGTRVRMDGTKDRGVIKIEYRSARQLDELFRRLAASGK